MSDPAITRAPAEDVRLRRPLDQLNALLGTLAFVLKTSTTQTGNTAATETTLFSYALPGNELGLDDSVEFQATGTFAATSSTNKRIRVKFGATTFYDSGNLSITTANKWSLRGSVTRTGATSQKCEVTLCTSSSTLRADVGYSTAAETLSSSVNLLVTGSGTNANDVVGERFKVMKIPD